MSPTDAALNTLTRVKAMEIPPRRDPSGESIENAAWMLNGIIHSYIQHEKAHRWLGYAQAILVSHGLVTLEEMKVANAAPANDGDKQ